ncbi:MAG: hypothetical protein HGA98_03555 [Deltaproteobacteria bacterium]|nr:hypothetical protein [Deltaproteobacteria bacterium]
MGLPGRRLALAAAAVLAAAALLWPVPVLEVRNDSRGTTRVFRLGPGRTFSVTYRHSLYDQPVTEEFSAAPGGLALTRLASPSGAVLEYFGFPDSAPSRAMQRRLGTVVFRVAAGEAQQLEAAGRRVSFLALGDHGDRLTARASAVPRWALLLAGTP